MEQLSSEEEIRARRRQRIEAMQHSKEMQLRRRRYLKILAPIVAGAVFITVILFSVIRSFGELEQQKDYQAKEQITISEQETIQESGAQSEGKGQEHSESTVADVAATSKTETQDLLNAGVESPKESVDEVLAAAMPEENPTPIYSAKPTEDTLTLSDEIVSNYALLIDLESDDILAQKNARTIINPASMTKILTVLVAAEHVTDLDDTFTMTLDITDYSYVNDCSNAGFLEGEEVTVRDLFYGTVLPSGGDAAAGLATYVAGSMEGFVELMNQKLDELGLSETAHVTNCVGLYHEDHYCTVYDMAMILEAAIENDLCREVLSAHTYTTSATTQHPEGILLSNWFLRRIEDKDTGGIVMCGKTGYVVESGNCAASYAVDKAGKGYICVTADATSSWRCIYDHVALYKQFSTPS